MIHKPSTQLEADIAFKDSLVLEAAEAAHHAVTVMQSVYDRFWTLPADRLLAVLNHDITSSLAVLQANTAIGTPCNASLDALDLAQFSKRAPNSMPDGWVFDGTEFTYTNPVQDP